MLLLMPISGRLANIVQPKYLMAFGLAAVAIAMWHPTTLEQDAGFGFFAWMRLYQMIGLPFLFVPINTVAYSELRPESTGQASSLINVARNLGGSVGRSLANTELMQRAQFHQSRLVESAIPSSSSYQHALERVTEFFVAQGSSLITAQGQAVGWIGQTILNQSVLISYMDVFWGYAIFALLMVPLALTVRNVNQTTEPPGHG
jgi:DHA2 family multidrug resistance protein